MAMNRFISIIISISVLIIAVSVGYYFVVFLPKKEMLEIEYQRQDRLDADKREQLEKEEIERVQSLNKTQLLSCLSVANDKYLRYAEINGTKKEDGTIWASNNVWDRAEKMKKEMNDNCYKLFPQE